MKLEKTLITTCEIHDIQFPQISKSNFLKVYISQSLDWNGLTETVQSIAEVETVKTNMKQIFGKIECYKLYLMGNTEGHIHLARIQMKQSGLNSQWKKHHFINF